MTLWLPSNLTTVTLEGWYRVHDVTAGVADGADVSTTTTVASWADRSGHGRTLIADSTNLTYSANGLATGHPSLINNGGAGLRTAAGVGYPSSAVIGAVALGSLTSGARVVSLKAASGNDYDGQIPLLGGATSNQYWYNFATATSPSFTSGAVTIMEGVPKSTTTADAGTNTVFSGSPVTIAAETVDRVGVWANAGTGSDNPSTQAKIAEVVIFAGVISTAELQQLEGYIAWANGQQALLPGAHPYFAAAPTTAGGGGGGFYARHYYDLNTRIRNV